MSDDRCEALEELPAIRGFQVQHEAAFAAIDRVEGRALGADRPDHLPRRIAGWRLDLDHVGAEVREQHRAEGPGHELRDVQDAHALQGARPAAGKLLMM